MHRVWFVWAVVAAPLLGACGGEDTAAQVGEAREDMLVPAELGGSYDFEVLRAKGEEVTADHAKLLRFAVEADTTFAAVMRQREPMDPYLALYPPQSKDKIAVSDWHQATVPMGLEDDAVILHRAREAGDYAMLAADLELDADAGFQVDLVALDIPLPKIDLTRTNPAVRAINGALREDEPQVSAFIVSGALSEGDDGLLVMHPKALPSLKDRATLNGVAARVNDARTQLFDEYVRANAASSDAPRDPELVRQVGVALGALWRALRKDTHSMR